jgi:tRNA(Ile)-lysidine synthase
LIDRQVHDTIRRHGMFRPGDRVIVAVSGGPDSVALLDLLAALAPTLRLELHVAHLDHGWRGRAAAADAGFVRRLALRLGLPVTVGHVPPATWKRRAGRQSSREARARDLRYAFLVETARAVGARRIALGHTRDDQAETLLLNLLRGSGGRGLGGIRPVRDDLFVRPLIETRRRDLLAWLKRRRLRYRVDATNRDLALTRNRVRRSLIPLLERRFNPRVVDLLARTAGLLRDDEAVLEAIAGEALDKAAGRRQRGRIDLRAAAIRPLPAALQRRVLRRAVAEVRGDLRRITARQIEACRDLLEHRPGRGRPLSGGVDLPGGVTVRAAPGTLTVSAVRPAAAAGTAVETLCPVPGRCELPGFGVRLKTRVMSRSPRFDPRAGAPDRVCLDADLARGPLRIRGRRPGDRFRPLGAPGARKVKTFLIDRKVPADLRARIPIVLSGDRIAWVMAQAIDDRFKVTPSTRRILVLEKETA